MACQWTQLIPFYNYFWDTTIETEDAYHVISGILSDSSNNVFYVNPIVVYIDNFINDINPPSGLYQIQFLVKM